MKKYYFGEWVHVHNDDEIEDVIEYFRLWKLFLIRKTPKYTLVDEQIIERSAEDCDIYKIPRTYGVKICLEGPENKYEFEQNKIFPL